MTDSNMKYLNLKNVIGLNIFRVPDYQRGFAWEEKHFDALWKDLLNLQQGKLAYHYTGIITVEKIKPIDYQHWKDAFYFEEYKGYYVVDGQQRLTSVTILLYEIIKAYFDQPTEKPEELRLLKKSRAAWMEDYFIRHKDRDFNEPTFVFGYDTDNPSDLFFRSYIMEQEQYKPLGKELEITAYTNQLKAAKKCFEEKIQNFLNNSKTGKPSPERYEKLAELCRLLTEKLMFDFKILDDSLDIFMVFETMNTRGKRLSNLEQLKNRLVYLATLLLRAQTKKDKLPDYRENELRTSIVDGWKHIYMELGRDERLLNSDNSLLNQHWIMYDKRPQKRDGMYVEDLFEERFIVSKVVDKEISAADIEHYVASLVEAAGWWYVIANPSSSKAVERVKNDIITNQMIKISRLTARYRYCIPLVFAVMAFEGSIEHKQDFFVALERYLFLVFSLSGRRSNTGQPHFMGLASQVYHRLDDWKPRWVGDSLYEWTYGGEGYDGYFRWQLFKKNRVDYFFEQPHDQGYHHWKELKYFLAEYNSPHQALKDYKQYHVARVHRSDKEFNAHTLLDKQIQEASYLQGSLGNYVLVKNPPRNWDTLSFEAKKQHIHTHQPDHDLLQYTVWNRTTIAERGKKMLQFLEERWETYHESYRLSEAEQLDLLYLNFMQDETEL